MQTKIQHKLQISERRAKILKINQFFSTNSYDFIAHRILSPELFLKPIQFILISNIKSMPKLIEIDFCVIMLKSPILI